MNICNFFVYSVDTFHCPCKDTKLFLLATIFPSNVFFLRLVVHSLRPLVRSIPAPPSFPPFLSTLPSHPFAFPSSLLPHTSNVVPPSVPFFPSFHPSYNLSHSLHLLPSSLFSFHPSLTYCHIPFSQYRIRGIMFRP